MKAECPAVCNASTWTLFAFVGKAAQSELVSLSGLPALAAAMERTHGRSHEVPGRDASRRPMRGIYCNPHGTAAFHKGTAATVNLCCLALPLSGLLRNAYWSQVASSGSDVLRRRESRADSTVADG